MGEVSKVSVSIFNVFQEEVSGGLGGFSVSALLGAAFLALDDGST